MFLHTSLCEASLCTSYTMDRAAMCLVTSRWTSICVTAEKTLKCPGWFLARCYLSITEEQFCGSPEVSRGGTQDKAPFLNSTSATGKSISQVTLPTKCNSKHNALSSDTVRSLPTPTFHPVTGLSASDL